MTARIPFARYMERCLYDEAFGYYAAGRVRFGLDGHFSTYAERLSPLFGRMVTRAIRDGIVALEAAGRLPEGAPLTVLELGAGNGDLARDVLDELVARCGEDGWGFAERLTYVIGETSEELRDRQLDKASEHVAAGRLAVHPMDAMDLVWDGPFYGVVFANELVDAFPCEHLILTSGLERGIEPAVRRVMVWGEVASEAVGSQARFWAAVAAGEPLRVRADAVPWTEAWPEGVPDGLEDHLAHLAPLVDDLSTCSLLPASLLWAPGTARFIGGLAALVDGPDRAGVALLVDYGGTSRHVLDPRTRAPHLRAYAGRDAVGPLDSPGQVDLTWDVDFTDMGRLARVAGLSVLHFGRQAGLEGSGIDLDASEARDQLVASLGADGYARDEAISEAQELVASFRQSRGFHLLALGPEGVALPENAFGARVSVDAHDTVGRDVEPEAIDAALADLGLEQPSRWLLPCCDPRANCADHDVADHADEVIRLLDQRGWLRGAGRV